MIDTGLLKGDLESLKSKLKFRHSSVDLDYLSELVSKRSNLTRESEELKNKRNEISKKIGIARSTNQKADELLMKAASFAKEISSMEHNLSEINSEYKQLIDQIPNICDEDVPLGEDESSNVVVKMWGDELIKKDGKSHDELLKTNYLDSERAAKISGARFAVLRNRAATLERELANFMIREHISKGYEEISIPFLVKEKAMFNSGQLPKFKEDAYSFDAFYLIPTGEVSLVNLYSNEILDEKMLSKKLVCYSPCFRKESGSYGKDTKGLIRLHQFSKVELVKIVKPEESDNELDSLVADAESILQKLKLPYRVVLKCRGDTGFTASKTFDLEVWMPSQNKFREISSCSNTRDFQSRRSSIKFRRGKKNEYAHLLNGSGLAVGRTIAAIVENYQITND
ncbi:MAG TPA: serine--tRNA ligase, partial [Fusobacteria bacterium]|nr:serine--tRNA ligase [Fusobacteriota bacterium]